MNTEIDNDSIVNVMNYFDSHVVDTALTSELLLLTDKFDTVQSFVAELSSVNIPSRERLSLYQRVSLALHTAAFVAQSHVILLILKKARQLSAEELDIARELLKLAGQAELLLEPERSNGRSAKPLDS